MGSTDIVRGGQRLPMLPAHRPVDPNWKCQRSGDCCTLPKEVVMTKEEAAILVHAAPKEISMQFRSAGDGFVALKAAPCPLFAFNGCLVYEVRPYTCRRFACMRPDVKAEKFEPNGDNLFDRVRVSRVARRVAEKFQRKAQVWARKHGWGEQHGSGQ